MADISLEATGFRELYAKLDKLTPEIKRETNKEMLVAALLVESEAKRLAPRGETGQLAASIGHKFGRISGLITEISVGSNSKYAAIQEFGGTIKNKAKQFLTIPFDGVKGWARDFQKTFIAKSKAGNLIIFRRVGKKDKEPLFVLKKEVTIPAHPWLNPALNKNKDQIFRMIGDAVKRGLQNVAGK